MTLVRNPINFRKQLMMADQALEEYKLNTLSLSESVLVMRIRWQVRFISALCNLRFIIRKPLDFGPGS